MEDYVQNKLQRDYKEVLQLALMFVDGGQTLFSLNKPGAFHKARWMSKIIYCIKLALLEKKILLEIPGKVFAKGQAEKIRKFVHFLIKVYIPWWYDAPFPEEAAHSDFNLHQLLFKYLDQSIAKQALTAMSRHTWYLSEELIPLALFSDKICSKQKEALVQQLQLTYSEKPTFKRFGSGYGKPCLPSISPTSELSHFIGTSSWNFFNILQIQPQFLNILVSEWQSSPNFVEALTVVKNLKVVNDSAKRGVKLAYDFLASSRKEQHYQNVLQVVENDRAKIPNQRKRTSDGGRVWFMYTD